MHSLSRIPSIFSSRQATKLNTAVISRVSVRSYYQIAPEPFHYFPGHEPTVTTVENAVSCVKSGNRVFIHSAAAAPQALIKGLIERGRSGELKNVEICHMHTEGNTDYAKEEFKGIFRANTFFTAGNIRPHINSGNAEFTPIFLRDIPRLFRENRLPVDVAMISVSPPDRHGYCSIGPSVDITRSALQAADIIIAMVNKNIPRTLGDSIIHKCHFNYMVECDEPLHCPDPGPISPAEMKIGSLIASNLVADGATLQMGIGRLPDAVAKGLVHHKNLGIHTEMCSDGAMDLVMCGALTNALKNVERGRMTTSFALGSRKFMDFLDDNPSIVFRDTEYVNNPAIIASNPKVTSINACIEIDITGQVVSGTIGNKIFSGVGGQVDFVLGAMLCRDGGRPIIACTSQTPKGVSRIVGYIQQGAAVTTSREHVHYIVTEYGIAELFGKTLKQRARALIDIAHPGDRENLEKIAKERNLM
eukprot:c3248_g1_i1.p1 GENE.c3248_g1_i1~~c3248_g1_i1.p1  ORF type:complete len:474 (+),score=187.38 c3248_g1_i1:61-1482(+)